VRNSEALYEAGGLPALQVTGKCGSVSVRLIPAPRGAGIVAARTPKKVLQMAGIEDCYTSATGSTKTLGNFVKVGCSQALLRHVFNS
jgi:ribosomal protein S5